MGMNRNLHPTTAEHMLEVNMEHSAVDRHILAHKTSLKTIKIIEIMQTMLSGHKRFKCKISKTKIIWILQIFKIEQCTLKYVKKSFMGNCKHFEVNENKNTTYQNHKIEGKAMPVGKFMA